MKSTDNDINNPLRITGIDISNSLMSAGHYVKRTAFMPQNFYDRMEVPRDPNVLFCITDKEGKFYLGDVPVSKKLSNQPKYVLSIEDNKFYVINLLDNGFITEICRFINPNDAIERLQSYQKFNNHNTIVCENINNVINLYIGESLSIHEAIMHIMTCAGFDKDPDFQFLNELAISNGITSKDKDFNSQHLLSLGHYRSTNKMVDLYTEIYNIFVLFINNIKKNKDVRCVGGYVDDIPVVQKIYDCLKSYA